MQYVDERHLCFDPVELGFPSIAGCHAIVYVTTGGLFGYHNLGNEREATWPQVTGAFGSFVRGNVNRGAGKMLYGVCYATGAPSRGYREPQKANWLAELAAFADSVDYYGQIWGYDLSNSDIDPSAYVYFSHMKVLGTCVIQARKWVASEERKGANGSPTNHKTTTPPTFNIKEVEKVTNSVGATALKTYYPEKLRG